MNREALRVSARNGCVQPVRGHYGAVPLARPSRPRLGVRLRSIALVLLLGGLSVLGYLLVTTALQPRPTLRILSPAPNSVIADGFATVTVDVRHTDLSSAASSSRGYHLHYYLDADIPIDPTKPAIPASGAWTSTTKTTHEWSLRGEGLHILAVQIVTNDDRPLTPPVTAAVVVRVPKPAPAEATPQPTTPVK